MSDIDLDDANKQADDLWSMAMAGRGDDYDMTVQDAVGTMQALIARVRELEAKIEPVRQALRMACAGSCTCMTKTPDIVFHATGCVYRRLVELERNL